MDANLGTTDGSYSNVTLGAAGPLAGSARRRPAFNGTSSYVTLPANLITDSTNVTVGLWFKAASSTASGVLFSYQADALSNSTGDSDHHDPALYVGSNGELYGEFWNGSIDPIAHHRERGRRQLALRGADRQRAPPSRCTWTAPRSGR